MRKQKPSRYDIEQANKKKLRAKYARELSKLTGTIGSLSEAMMKEYRFCTTYKDRESMSDALRLVDRIRNV